MQISYSKKNRPPYINFRMRKLICNFILENAVTMYSMDANEKAKYIAEKIESMVTENYWIKDKRKDISNGSTSLTTGATFVQLKKIA